jgi:hypothetical protein
MPAPDLSLAFEHAGEAGRTLTMFAHTEAGERCAAAIAGG